MIVVTDENRIEQALGKVLKDHVARRDELNQVMEEIKKELIETRINVAGVKVNMSISSAAQ